MDNRLACLRAYLEKNKLAGVIISKPENIYYFSGFTGSSGMLLVGQDCAVLITDFRYLKQAEQQVVGLQIMRCSGKIVPTVVQAVKQFRLRSVAFESDYTTYDIYRELKFQLNDVKLEPARIDSIRMVKDLNEINLIKKAVSIADLAFNHILSYIKPGISEAEVAIELEYYMKKLGAQGSSFTTIVASGYRSALPHGTASAKVIEYGDFVTLDFGAKYEGYCSDITRTVLVGCSNPKQREIYNLVLDAQLAGLDAVKPGRLGFEVDSVARGIIQEAGYGEFFGHGLGHGLGLAIHEEPRLSPANDTVRLEPNMVLTIEPGIYLPDWGGVRIEDTVVVTADGCDILTTSSKQLIELI